MKSYGEANLLLNFSRRIVSVNDNVINYVKFDGDINMHDFLNDSQITIYKHILCKNMALVPIIIS